MATCSAGMNTCHHISNFLCTPLFRKISRLHYGFSARCTAFAADSWVCGCSFIDKPFYSSFSHRNGSIGRKMGSKNGLHSSQIAIVTRLSAGPRTLDAKGRPRPVETTLTHLSANICVSSAILQIEAIDRQLSSKLKGEWWWDLNGA